MTHAPLARGLGRARPAALTSVAGLLAGALLLGGCADLRLETPPPAMPTPDAVELVRDRTARDAVDLAALATQATLSAPEAVATLLGRVAEVSVAHADAFGGVYEPFPDVDAEETGATPAPTPTSTPVPADADAVLAALRSSADTARTDADGVADGDLGRLLASVWVSRTLLAEELDAALLAAAALAGAAPEPTPSAPPAPPAVPAQIPAGADVADVLVLVQSEDAAGFAWEVVAARSADSARADASVRAAWHRDRAEDWAMVAGVARSEQDPRRAAYDLPDALTVDSATAEAMAVVTMEVEAALGVAYTSLVARPDAGARGPLLDAMLDQVRRGRAVGAPVPAFPGLPERA